VHRGNAGRLEPLLQPEVELGSIHADEQRGTALEQCVAQAAPDAQDFTVVAQRLGVAAYGELVHRHGRFESLRGHARPADAGKAQAGASRLQRGDQVRAELVAGGLAGHHGDACRSVGHRPSG